MQMSEKTELIFSYSGCGYLEMHTVLICIL